MFFLTILLWVVNPSKSESQTVKPKWSFSAALHHGFILAHRSTIVALQKDHVRSAEIGWMKQSAGNRSWHELYNFPRIGLKYHYFDLGNEKDVGYAHSIVPNLNFNFSKKENLCFRLSIGMGAGYFTKKFLARQNYKNLAIGSRFTVAISFTAGLEWRIAEHVNLLTGLAFNHFSNGAVRTPNLGLNIPSASIGLLVNSGKTETRSYPRPPFSRQWRKSIAAGGAVKQRYPVNGPDYGVVSLALAGLKPVSQKSAVGAGADLHYDGSLHTALENNGRKAPVKDALRAGLNVSYELLFADFSLLIQCGHYLYSKYTSEGKIYQRIGMRYEFTPGLFGCLNLRSHFGKADFFEAGIGKRF